MRLILIRHARTASNRDGVYAGLTDDSLLNQNDGKLLQLGRILQSHLGITAYASPLKRTLMTCEKLLAKPSTKIELCPDLIEMDFGPWTGLTAEEVRNLFPDEWDVWRRNPFLVDLQGFEGLTAVQQRATRWLDDIRCASPNAVVISHEAVIKAILCKLDEQGARLYRQIRVDNLSVQVLDRNDRDGNWTIVHRNVDHSELAQLLTQDA